MKSYQVCVVSSLFLTPPVLALPQGAEIRAGDVAISQSAQEMQILQNSQRAIVNYDAFSIGANEAVKIQQPDASSVLVNRVKAGGPMSEIYGQLQSNGQVFLINQAGILVGGSAQINVGGLLLTTHDISDENLMKNELQFMTSGKPAMVQIDGQINVDPGSFVIVISSKIELNGSIIAQFGKVSLVSADGASVLLEPGQWPQIEVTQSTYDAWIHQNGLIKAEGGLVEITAASASDLIDRVIYHEGETDVSSRELVERDGKVFIEKTGIAINTNDTKGFVEVTGKLDASGDNTSSIDVEGAAVFLRDGSQILNNGVTGDGGETRIIADALSVEKDAHLEAKGGTHGDGGFVELSGHDELDIAGSVDTTAENGKTGQLLIDPRNITINNAANGNINSTSDGTVYFPIGSGNSILNINSLKTALESNNVTVTTADTDSNSPGSQDGDLTLAVTLDIGNVNGNTLTLNADDVLSINANIEDVTPDATGGNANIILRATNDIQMATGTRIDAGTGQIQVESTNADFTVQQLFSDYANGVAVNINVGGSIIDGNDSVTLADNVVLGGTNAELSMTAGSYIDQLEGFVPILSAVSTAQDVKGFSQTAAGVLQLSRISSASAPLIGFTATTSNGAIKVQGNDAETNPGISILGSGRVNLQAGGASDIVVNDNISTASGAIALTAAGGAITMGAASSITSTTGKVSLFSQNSQTIGVISTGSSANDAISLEVTGGEDILDAHDILNDTTNLIAPNGGLDLVSADNFAGIETEIKRFNSDNLNVSEIVLNEKDDLIVNNIIGNTTGVTIVAGGNVAVDTIDTSGTVTIQADRISEYYANQTDQTNKTNVASISASSVDLIANKSIGDISDTDMSVTDYLDVDTTALSLQLLTESASTNANEIAVQQVSSNLTGPMVVSTVATPASSNQAKVALASLNNSLNVSGTNFILDAADALSLAVFNAESANSVRILLPSLASVQAWSLQGLSLTAQAAGTSISTLETAGATLLSSLTSAARQFVLLTNSAFNLNFSGTSLDMSTTDGDLNVVATSAVDIQDLNNDGDAFKTDDGNLRFAGQGTLSLRDTISATDNTNDNVRAGLIDLTTSSGNILVGAEDLTMLSTNTVDNTLDGGIGDVPGNQTAIRIAQTGARNSASIVIGAADSTTSIVAEGGDIYMASGLNAVSRSVNERTLDVNETVTIEAYNQDTDPLETDNLVLDEVTLLDTTATDARIAAHSNRYITLSSVNIPGFNLDPSIENVAEDAIDDVERNNGDLGNPNAGTPGVLEDESQTRLNVMLDTVVPECETGDTLDSEDCLKKQGFKEFLRSLVLGRGFPDTFKGLPK